MQSLNLKVEIGNNTYDVDKDVLEYRIVHTGNGESNELFYLKSNGEVYTYLLNDLVNGKTGTSKKIDNGSKYIINFNEGKFGVYGVAGIVYFKTITGKLYYYNGSNIVEVK